MVRPLLVAILALWTVLALPSISAASHDPSGAPLDEDFVTGREILPETCTPSLCFHIALVFDVHSGPSGENVTGTVRIDIESPPGNVIDTFGTASVTCLIVSGNRATMGAGAPVFGLVSVEDNDGAGQDRSGVSLPSEPLVCPTSPSTAVSPIFGGDITVHDAPAPPASKDQCANGGWRGFPGFRNRGDCVSFVATDGKNRPAGT
jgi:hypothetical protein